MRQDNGMSDSISVKIRHVTHVRPCVSAHVCACAYACACTWICMYVYMYVCGRRRVRRNGVCVCVRVCVCVKERD